MPLRCSRRASQLVTCALSAASFPPAADDYAHKEWSGLLHDSYRQRWQMFAQEFSAQFGWQAWRRARYFEFTKGWTEQRNMYPAEPTGDPVSTAAAMLSSGIH